MGLDLVEHHFDADFSYDEVVSREYMRKQALAEPVSYFLYGNDSPDKFSAYEAWYTERVHAEEQTKEAEKIKNKVATRQGVSKLVDSLQEQHQCMVEAVALCGIFGCLGRLQQLTFFRMSAQKLIDNCVNSRSSLPTTLLTAPPSTSKLHHHLCM